MWQVQTPNSPIPGSPKDERFYTPRSMTRNSSGGSLDWNSPRDMMRSNSIGYNTTSDSEYRTPRMLSEREDNFHSTRSANFDDNEGFYDVGAPVTNLGFSSDSQQMEDEDLAAGIDKTDLDELFRFSRHGRADEVERLLSSGIPVDVRDENGNTVLIIACQNGNKRVAKAALRRGANINARNLKGNTPLHFCFHCK